MISNTRREFLTLGTTAAVGLAIPRGSWAIGTGAGCPMFKGVNFGYYIRNGQLSSQCPHPTQSDAFASSRR